MLNIAFRLGSFPALYLSLLIISGGRGLHNVPLQCRKEKLSWAGKLHVTWGGCFLKMSSSAGKTAYSSAILKHATVRRQMLLHLFSPPGKGLEYLWHLERRTLSSLPQAGKNCCNMRVDVILKNVL